MRCARVAVMGCIVAMDFLFGVPSSHASLVAYWPLDTSSSGVTPDVIGPNEGTLLGDAAIAVDGTRGQVLVLDGTGDYLNAGADSSLNFGASDFTLSFWIKTTASTRSFVAARHNPVAPAEGYSFEIRTNTTTSLTRASHDDGPDNALAISSQSLLDGAWHHVAWVVKGMGQPTGAANIFVDGNTTPWATVSLSNIDSLLNPGTFYIGARFGADLFLNGRLDDFAAWSNALPIASIQGLANGTYSPLTTPVPEPGSCALIVIGGLGLYAWRRRRQTA